MSRTPCEATSAQGVFLSPRGGVTLHSFERASVDDLMKAVVERIVTSGVAAAPSRGATWELTGASLELTNPLARLSRSEHRGRLFSALGELLWYLSGSNSTDHISYYISQYRREDQDGLIAGAYGPRMVGPHSDQLGNVIRILERNPSSRRAVIQLLERADLMDRQVEIPCTSSIQFLVRGNELHACTYMRSNDAYLGLPHDVFAFTMLQEIIARTLRLTLGRYHHFVGSLHLYEAQLGEAQAFAGEGWQSTALTMPAMPDGDPWGHIRRLLEAERLIRLGVPIRDVELPDSPYWGDLGRLLAILRMRKDRDRPGIAEMRTKMTSSAYNVYIQARLDEL